MAVRLNMVIENCRECPYASCNNNGGWCGHNSRPQGNPWALHDGLLPGCPLPRVLGPVQELEDDVKLAEGSSCPSG